MNWKEKKESTKLIRISEKGFTGKRKYVIEINKWTTLFARTRSAQLNLIIKEKFTKTRRAGLSTFVE